MNTLKITNHLLRRRQDILNKLEKTGLYFEEDFFDIILEEDLYENPTPHIVLAKIKVALFGSRLLHFKATGDWFLLDQNKDIKIVKEQILIDLLRFLGQEIFQSSFDEKDLDKTLKLLRK